MISTTKFTIVSVRQSPNSPFEYECTLSDGSIISQQELINRIESMFEEDPTQHIEIYFNQTKMVEFDIYQVYYVDTYLQNRTWFLKSIYNKLDNESNAKYYITFANEEIHKLIIRDILMVASTIPDLSNFSPNT